MIEIVRNLRETVPVRAHEIWLRREYRRKGYGKEFFKFFEECIKRRDYDSIGYYTDHPAGNCHMSKKRKQRRFSGKRELACLHSLPRLSAMSNELSAILFLVHTLYLPLRNYGWIELVGKMYLMCVVLLKNIICQNKSRIGVLGYEKGRHY